MNITDGYTFIVRAFFKYSVAGGNVWKPIWVVCWVLKKFIPLSLLLQTLIVCCTYWYLSAETHKENPTYCSLCQEGQTDFPLHGQTSGFCSQILVHDRHPSWTLLFSPLLHPLCLPAQILVLPTLFNTMLLDRAASKRHFCSTPQGNFLTTEKQV